MNNNDVTESKKYLGGHRGSVASFVATSARWLKNGTTPVENWLAVLWLDTKSPEGPGMLPLSPNSLNLTAIFNWNIHSANPDDDNNTPPPYTI